MTRSTLRLAVVLAALAGAAPLSAQPAAPAAGPSPAVVAMRWQWLNPEINSFTFRETKDVFEYRDVRSGDEVWDLSRAEGFAMPAIQFGGERG